MLNSECNLLVLRHYLEITHCRFILCLIVKNILDLLVLESVLRALLLIIP